MYCTARDLRAKLELALERLLDACCHTEARHEAEDGGAGPDTEWLARSQEVRILNVY